MGGGLADQISTCAYLASVALAREKESFPLFDRGDYLAGETVRGLQDDVRAAIAEHGIRNALLTSITPTGTISLVADNVSSGIEPVFALAYTRKVLQPDGSRTEEEISDYALRRFHEIHGVDAPLPAHFVTAQYLTSAEHIRMQAAVQCHVDSAISKTVNVPASIGFEAFQQVYLDAYASGCKGCTTYRPNAITGSLLEVKSAEPSVSAASAPDAEPTRDEVPPTASTPGAPTHPLFRETSELMSRSEKLTGATYKLCGRTANTQCT